MGFRFKFESQLPELLRRLAAADGTEVEVGFFEGDTYGSENHNLPVAAVAAYNEFGTTLNPTRPFMQETFEDRGNQRKISEAFVKIASTLIGSKRGVKGQFTSLGAMVRDMMKISIEDYPGSNSPRTIARKGFNDPLKDTGKLLNSVRFKVNKGV